MRTAAVTGATSPLARALILELSRDHRVLALVSEAAEEPSRTCDLFNLRSTERALEGVDVAFYLVDAMFSSSRVSQGSTEDLDLLCADNFARAARTAGVREIVYAGDELSSEIERALGAHGVTVSQRVVAAERSTTTRRTVARARSVQRLPLPKGRDADWVAGEYARWLPQFMRPVLRVAVDDARNCRFYVRPLPTPLLVLTFAADRSTPDRQLFFVTGGMLAHPSGATERARLEFRAVLDNTAVLAAIHDFAPRLPFFVYELTQARVHLFVMDRFAAHLAASSD